jgi:sulfate/thiosulfate transport system permease protein
LAAKFQFKQHSVLPGFNLTLGYTLLYLSLIVLIPLSALVLRTTSLSWEEFVKTVTSPRVVASYKLTFGAAFIGAVVNVVFGFVVAWSLVRYRFPGRKLIDALVDLPFALPTAVSGIALTTIYAKSGMLGYYFAQLGIKTAYSQLGICIAMTFIGLPFVVRTLQPALEELDGETEEAAASLGANRWQTFRRVIFPSIFPALITGFSLAFARALGEYGSVAFISGNRVMETEVASLLIIAKLDQFDVPGATAIGVVMLLLSFLVLLLVNAFQWWMTRRYTKPA